MYLSIATTHRPATDLGFLLHKHPESVHEASLAFGTAVLFFPEATEDRCEAVLVLDIDPIGLVRGRGRSDGLLDQYVNDRPYAASSFLSVALARSLRTAMGGTSKGRPDLAQSEIPLEAVVSPLPARGGASLVRDLFAPLGWQVEATPIADREGAVSRYVSLRLTGTARLCDLLNHLYVLIPVLDDDKHYWVGEDEVAKLMARGEGWLADHPAKELIVRRYLSHRRNLAHMALKRLAPEAEVEEGESGAKAPPEDAIEKPLRLNDLRMDTVVEALRRLDVRAVADLGCGEGKLLTRLVYERKIRRIVGVDVTVVALERAAKRLKLEELGGPGEGRVSLLQSALNYRDKRLEGFDAVTLIEVIEHLDPERLSAMARVVFGEAKPRHVIVTTPNAEHNVLFDGMAPGAMRHPDHRFEWTRAEFQAWARDIGESFGYLAELQSIGAEDATHGAPTQMAVFSR